MEVLVATALTLVLLGAVVQLFAWMSTSLNEARAGLEMQDRLRAAAQVLQRDLRGVTTPMLPPRNPADNEGYFEYVEGAMGICPRYTLKNESWSDGAAGSLQIPVNTFTFDLNADGSSVRDFTVTDTDDVLMFTTRTSDRPFVGQNVRYQGAADVREVFTVDSSVAEVMWFVRGRTLFRRQLLVAPNTQIMTISGNAPAQVPLAATDHNFKGGVTPTGMYTAKVPGGVYFNRDISMRSVPDGLGGLLAAANTLGDLTKRENRYGHPGVIELLAPVTAFPYDVSRWGAWRMPTKRESAELTFWPGGFPIPWRPGTKGIASYQQNPRSWWKVWGQGGAEFWGAGEVVWDGHNPFNPHPSKPTDRDPGPPYYEDWIFAGLNYGWLQANDPDRQVLATTAAARHATDVVMNNVIGFDVKAWDPGAPLFRYRIQATNDQPARNIVLSPGDPGYAQAAGIFFRNPQNGTVFRVGYGAFVNLGYLPDGAAWVRVNNQQVSGFVLSNPPGAPQPHFNNVFYWDRNEYMGREKALAMLLTRTYDTWSTHYDADPSLRHVVWDNYWKYAKKNIYNNTGKYNIWGKTVQYEMPFMLPDPNNGFDDAFDPNTIPTVLNPTDSRNYGPDGQRETFFRPPYPFPLRAVEVRIRAFEPSSRQVREITIKQDFLIR